MMLHHRDDSRVCHFHMLLHLRVFSLLADSTGVRSWRGAGGLQTTGRA